MTNPVTCLHCGSTSPTGAKFCVSCGKPIGTTQCANCGKDVPGNAQFCISCGEPLEDPASTELKSGNVWVRRPGDFACRLEVKDLKGLLNRGVAIEEGTCGLFFQQGSFVGTLDPGGYTVQTVAERLKALVIDSPCEVVLIDMGDLEVPLEITGLNTRENLPVNARLKLVADLEGLLEFYVNLMRSQRRITARELSDRIRQQVAPILQRTVADCTRDELYANPELAERIEDELRDALERTFSRIGLVFQHVEFVEFFGEAYDEIRRQEGELAVGQQAVELRRRRNALKSAFEKLLDDRQMEKIQRRQDFDEFLKQVEHEAGVKDLLRQQERDELYRQYEENKQDHALARRHLLATLDWQRRREQLDCEMQYKRQLVENKGELDEAQRRQRLKSLEDEQRARIEREEREHQSRLQRIDQQHQQQIRQKRDEIDLQYDQDRREAELAMDLLRQTKQVKREEADADVDRDLHRQRGEQHIRTEAEEAAHRRELERLEKLSGMTHEALIASSPAEQAKVLAELKRTEALKGMTDEQILAAAADKSPDVARAFAEKFRAAATEESKQQMERLFERMVQLQTQASDARAADQQANMQMIKELTETALQTQRDTSVAAAQSQQQPGAAVIYPPPGSGAATVVGSQQTPQQPPASQTLHCPQCRAPSPPGSQFCGNCGFRFA